MGNALILNTFRFSSEIRPVDQLCLPVNENCPERSQSRHEADRRQSRVHLRLKENNTKRDRQLISSHSEWL
jgi:hypothetical protein